jgi:hypothetical protein
VQVVITSAPATASAALAATSTSKPSGTALRDELLHRRGIDVPDPEPVDAQRGAERERLELRLRAGPDQRHRARVRTGEHLGRHGGRRGRAQGGQHRHLATNDG